MFKMMSRHTAVLAAALAGVLAGCQDERTDPTSPATPRDAASASAPGRSGEHRPDELPMAQVASRVPGFGGFFADETGALVVYVTDLRQAGAARAAVAPLLRDRSNGLRGSVSVRQAQHGFTELQGWRDRMTDPVLAEDGVVFVDLDEKRNRVVVGVADASGRAAAQARVAALGVPAGAVEFEQAAYPETLAPIVYAPDDYSAPFNGSTLNDYRRPLQGGLQIAFRRTGQSVGEYYRCTMGFIAIRNGERVAVTNSHCSDRSWDLDNTSYFQPVPGTDRYIGYERSDPNGSSCGFASTNVCRNADAMAMYLDNGASGSKGYIARTAFFGSGRHNAGSRVIDGANPQFTITATGTIAGGAMAEKVGATTGWTRGTIDKTCVDLSVSYRTYSKLRCQTYATYESDRGDSGSPVFRSGSNGTATLLGIHWASSGDDQYAIFSSFAQIQKDLGTLDVLGPPPPPVYGVSISGDAYPPANTYQTYSASVTAGSAPFSYQWYINGYPVSTSSSYDAYVDTQPFTLSVTVTDATGAQVSSSLYVEPNNFGNCDPNGTIICPA